HGFCCYAGGAYGFFPLLRLSYTIRRNKMFGLDYPKSVMRAFVYTFPVDSLVFLADCRRILLKNKKGELAFSKKTSATQR
ncbi:MAG: hypothetical protein MR455_04710, partial [Prevotella sp.]|nr:hypothetical protein [Prevotella sp.]